MTEIIEHGDQKDPVVRVGDGPNEEIAPLRLYQKIYRQITGRPEQISRDYSNNLLIDSSSLEQLHYKMQQLCDVHRVVGWNESVSVFHEKERKEQFTSFEAFRNYNANTSSACVNVVLKYYFSLVPPTSERPQEYEVEIRLESRVARIRQLKEDEAPFIDSELFSYFAAEIAHIQVNYADYVVARGFMEAFDEWVSGCRSVPKKPWLIWAKRWSNVLPWAGRVLGAVLVGGSALRTIPHLGVAVTTEVWARFLVIYVVGLYLSVMFLAGAGHLAKVGIDRFVQLSYLRLNKGDEKVIEEFSGHNTGALARFVGGCLLALVLGVISEKLSKLV